MSKIKVNEISTLTGSDITITTGKTLTGTASQFKITGGTAGQALITDGSGGLTFGAVDSLPTQSGNADKFLKTDGTTATWETVSHDPTMGGDMSGTASNAQIAAGAVGATEIAAGAVGATEIAAGAVGATEIASTFDISSKTVTLPAASVTSHVTAYDDAGVRNDIATLALHTAISDNKAAHNLSNAFIDQFEDDTGIDVETTCDRDTASEFMASVTSTSEAYHVNANGYASSTGGSGGHVPAFSTTNNARTAFGASTGSSAFSLNSQSGKNSGIFTLESTLVQKGNGGGPHCYCYGVMKNNSTVTSYTGNAYSAYPTGTHFSLSSSVGHKIKMVYDTNSPNAITTYYDSGSGYGSAETGLSTVGANFTDALTTLYFFSPCWSDGTNAWIWDVSGTRVYGTTNATGNFTSATQTASSSVSEMGIVVLYKNNAGTAALNSGGDLIASVSANGGTNYTDVTLVAGGTFSTGINIAAVSGVSVTAGTAPKYKISFANQASGTKETQVHGVALLY